MNSFTAPAPRATPVETIRVAVRAIAYRYNPANPDEPTRTVRWRTAVIDAEVLGDYDAEASELPWGFEGAVIAVEDGLPFDDTPDGFPSGCSTWSQFSRDTTEGCRCADCIDARSRIADGGARPFASEYEHARAEHWGCEHALFGGRESEVLADTPPEEQFAAWRPVTDPAALAALESVDAWEFSTSPLFGQTNGGEYRARVMRKQWAAHLWHVTVERDDIGSLIAPGELATVDTLTTENAPGCSVAPVGKENFAEAAARARVIAIRQIRRNIMS